MLSLKIDQAKNLFFDRAAVTSAVDKAQQSVLSKFGAFVRQSARSLLRTRKKPSDPGQPPSSHLGLVKQFLFFVYEPEKKGVVIGPAQINRPSPDALAMLEHGGLASRRFFVDQVSESKLTKSGRIKRKTFTRLRASQQAVAQTVNYPARPFMQPAFEKEKPRLPDLWRNSVKG